MIVCTTQAAFISKQKWWFIGRCHFPKILGKKPKATTKVTLTSHESYMLPEIEDVSVI